jgi:hypothetical protein
MKTLDVYIAVPHDLDNQKLTTPVTFDPQPTDMLTDKWGQKVAHFRFTDVPATRFETAVMSVSATLYQTRYYVYPDKVGTLADIPAEIKKKLIEKSRWRSIPIETQEIRKQRKDLRWLQKRMKCSASRITSSPRSLRGGT